MLCKLDKKGTSFPRLFTWRPASNLQLLHQCMGVQVMKVGLKAFIYSSCLCMVRTRLITIEISDRLIFRGWYISQHQIVIQH